MTCSELLEEQLADELTRMGGEYASTLKCIEALAGCEPEQREAQLTRVQRSVSHISVIERRLQPLRDRWASLRHPPGTRLSGVLAAQERLLAELIERVRDCESRFAEDRARMLPAVDAHVRRRDMHRAYQRGRDSG
jgi:hypothetical protein